MGTAAVAGTVQEVVEAVQIAETIKYGQRAIEACNGNAFGCTAECAGAGWMIAQYDAAAEVAGFLIGAEVTYKMAGWQFKRAAKIAGERVKAAKAARKASGTARQIRMAIAA